MPAFLFFMEGIMSKWREVIIILAIFVGGIIALAGVIALHIPLFYEQEQA